MFKSIKFLENRKEGKLYKFFYLLDDTEIIAHLNVPIEIEIYESKGDASIIPSGIIAFYTQQNKNVAHNLALFYNKSFGTNDPVPIKKQLIDIDKDWTDIYFPSLEFGKKHYSCLLNQLDKLLYTGKK